MRTAVHPALEMFAVQVAKVMGQSVVRSVQGNEQLEFRLHLYCCKSLSILTSRPCKAAVRGSIRSWCRCVKKDRR